MDDTSLREAVQKAREQFRASPRYAEWLEFVAKQRADIEQRTKTNQTESA